MTRAATALEPEIFLRPYTESDESKTLEVLSLALGGGPGGTRTPEFFRWKHYENPFGRSFILLAEADEQIVGVRALMRWRFEVEDRSFAAVRAVDTATHPDWQGRGLFSRLTREAIERLRADTDFIFNTPNQKSLPGYLKMGWEVVAKVPVAVRVRRPLRFLRSIRSMNGAGPAPTTGPPVDALSAAAALDLPGMTELLDRQSPGSRLATGRNAPYLRWRYGNAPLLDYRAVVDGNGGRLSGLAIFRVRPRGELWETTVCEVIADDSKTSRRLLQAVMSAARVDHVTCHWPSRSLQASAARRLGFLSTPGGITFVVNRLRETHGPDPKTNGSWALALGDLEAF